MMGRSAAGLVRRKSARLGWFGPAFRRALEIRFLCGVLGLAVGYHLGISFWLVLFFLS